MLPKFTVSMMTANRLELGCKVNHLDGTIESLLKSEVLNSPLIKEFNIFDSGSQDKSFVLKHNHLANIISAERKLKLNENFLSLVTHPITTDYLVILQDDIVLSKRWLQHLESLLPRLSNSQILSGYGSYPHIKQQIGTDPIWRCPINAYYGNLCLVIPKELLSSLSCYVKDDINFGRVNTDDITLRNWYKKTFPEQKYIYMSCPSLVQHTGKHSSMKHFAFKNSPSFISEDYEPLWWYPKKITCLTI